MSALPPGPRSPSPVQTLGWLSRHIPYLEGCRDRYGDTFTLRFTTLDPLVFVSNPTAIKALFANDRDNTLPSGRALTLEPVLGPRSVLLLEGEEHMRRRKLMLPPFHGERMRAYEATIARVTRAEVASWPADHRFVLRARMQAITLEVILSAVFGVADGPRHDELRSLLGDVLAQTRRPLASAFAGITRPLGRLGPFAPIQRMLDRTDELLVAEITERRARDQSGALGEREDILSLLVGARFDDGSAMDDRELRDQLMTLLVAGHETTATALSWAFDFLLHDPDRLDDAREAAVAGEDAYLDAVATESQRLRPVITSVGRKLSEPQRVGTYELPAGTSMMASIYLAHTRPDVYADPYEFRPERFLGSRPETFSWLPFGGGVRRCIGAAFAQLEMRVVLREVLRHVDLAPASADRERAKLAGITLVPGEGTPVRIATRDHPAGLPS
ncbi:MAG: cytochrome P450 [Solirubrobacterales bacterium]|nr:cytochrome P450 [Thermoleophilales bacterium]MCO5328298.1 cytochrome P450 [Solirubrobacterales bacterium]